jgi:diaminohydroxyphosphoribosylaminopyrimidine deaminase/5-amino-6-(5-phosphoribosylamino)uracil reductase
MPIKTKRWNDPREAGDGFRLLICRYRPRALPKSDETWDDWQADLGPSRDLHAEFYGKHGEPITWEEYRGRYLEEMAEQTGEIRALAVRVLEGETITLLCSSACEDATHCHRTLLKGLIEQDMAAFDRKMMRRALKLAEQGRGLVEPNPLVGAVVVRGGKIVGKGWHQRYGAAHAEVNALAEAGDAARGATLYVTLEPCCHHGKTPPCTDTVLKAGLRRVVVAMSDPFPQVAGQGIEILRRAGLIVDVGVGETEARALNAPYRKLLRTGRSHVIAKWAMSLDGKIATHTGASKWISGEAARQRVHELRGRVDAIITGIRTVLADDPLLTARPPGPRTPLRVVLDSQLRLPLDSQLVRTAREAGVLVVHAPAAAARKRAALEEQGCECLAVESPGGRPSLVALLEELGRRRCTNVLVEGGAEVLGGFLEAREIDEVYAFIAPKLIGGKAPSAIAGPGVARLEEALPLASWKCEAVGSDWLLHGRRS